MVLAVASSLLVVAGSLSYFVARVERDMDQDAAPKQASQPVARPATPKLTLMQRVVDLETQLSISTAEAAKWKQSCILATSRAEDFKQRLEAADSEATSWQERATLAEAMVGNLDKHQFARPAPDDRFRRLRSLIARELHPDHTKTAGIERVVRTKLFKALWPQIEEI